VSSDSILILDEDNFDEQIQHRETPILVDFWASWCAPCRVIAPVLEELAAEFAGRARVAKVDVDENGDLTNRFGVRSVPTLIVFCRGKVVDQVVGNVPKKHLRELIGKQLVAARQNED
jgi:thioredoxin 1